MAEEDMLPLAEDSPEGTKTAVLPAYEYVKRSILYSWLKIENEYERYILTTSMEKNYRTALISSKILSLYKALLRPMMLKMKTDELIIKEMDRYLKVKNIPEDKIDDVVEIMAGFLHTIGLTNITYEQKPWQDRLKSGYGTF